MAGRGRGGGPAAEKSEREWREQLTDAQFEVTRRGATEPAFTGKSSIPTGLAS